MNSNLGNTPQHCQAILRLKVEETEVRTSRLMLKGLCQFIKRAILIKHRMNIIHLNGGNISSTVITVIWCVKPASVAAGFTATSKGNRSYFMPVWSPS